MQVRDNVNAANIMAVGMGASSKSNTDNNNDSDFANFLNKTDGKSGIIKDYAFAGKDSLSDNRKNVNNTKRADDITFNKSSGDSTVKNTKETKKLEQENDTDNDDVTKNSIDNISKDDGIAEVYESDIETDNVAELDEETIEEVIEILGDVLQVIMNQFEMTVPEVQESISDLNMDFPELLTEDGEKSFFLNMRSADVSELLTDETLSSELVDFMAEIENVKDNFPVSQEQISQLFENNIITDDDIREEAVKNNIRDFNDQVSINNDDISLYDAAEEDKTIVEIDVENYSEDSDDYSFEESKDTPDKKTRTSDNGSKAEIQNAVIQGINDAVNEVSEFAEVSGNTETGKTDIVEQIVEQIKVNLNRENTSLEMQLYPEHLGRIQIHVVSKDGVMTARIAAETETAKQAIEAGLNNLKESLSNQNLKVDAIEVMVSTTGFAESDQRQEQYQQETNNRRNRRGFESGDLDEEIPEEETDAQKMQAEGSSVSYRA